MSRIQTATACSLVLAAGLLSAAAGPVGPDKTAIVNGERVAVPNIPMGDAATIERILKLGHDDNHVMDHLTYLCEEIGPRLTGSANVEEANKWIRDTYTDWGLSNAEIEEWGTIPVRFDRGPSTAEVVSSRTVTDDDGKESIQYTTTREMSFTTLAWAPGTDGTVTGNVVRMPRTEEEFDAVADQLAGAWILIPNERRSGQRGVRGGTNARHAQRADARSRMAGDDAGEGEPDLLDRVLMTEPAGFMSSSKDERVWTSSVRGWRSLDSDKTGGDVEIIISEPDYAHMNSRLFDGEEITVQINADNIFTSGPIPVYNTIAEIKGTEWPEQVIIVSAHLDSWNGQGSKGTVDNGTGSAVTMEAARLLIESGAKPKRTIRFCHWTGEEQGLLGSRAYVELHKDDIKQNVSLCLVDDGGTNYEGGIQCIEPMKDYLAAATAPMNDVFYSDVDGEYLNVDVQVRNRMPRGGSSDHAAFNAIGVPGFFWNEVGRANYRYGWHTQYDRLDQAIPEYLRQSSTCAAITAYNLACAPDLLPREKPADGQE